MTGATIVKIIKEEIAAINAQDTLIDRDQLVKALDRAEQKVGYEEWEESMGDDL